MKPDLSKWRSSPSYDFVDEVASPDLAWEWLRRNENYQQDYRAVARQEAMDAPSILRFRNRWGLTFPGPARTVLRRYAGLLAAIPRSRQHRAGCGAVCTAR
ncbi:transcriptional regulator domain-containing protein [Paracoccus versutus]